eukprot:8547311-Lingulodinium_polyedra.AAC.1
MLGVRGGPGTGRRRSAADAGLVWGRRARAQGGKQANRDRDRDRSVAILAQAEQDDYAGRQGWPGARAGAWAVAMVPAARAAA